MREAIESAAPGLPGARRAGQLFPRAFFLYQGPCVSRRVSAPDPFLKPNSLLFPFFFGLVFGVFFGRPLVQFWLHFGSLWATMLPPKIDQKNNRISGRFLDAIWLHFSNDVLQFWHLF